MKGLLVLLSAVAFAACTPTIGILSNVAGGLLGHGGGVGTGSVLGGGQGGISDTLGSAVGGLIGGKRTADGKTDNGYKQLGYVDPKYAGTGLGGALASFTQGLTDHVGNAGSILDDVLHLRIPAVLDDGFNAIIGVGRGLGSIIDSLIPGLGSLFGNLVVSIGKILICLYGSPGLSGSLLGRTPGQDNPRDIPYICTPAYGRNWGSAYDGPYNANSIISHYHVSNAKQQALDFINEFTNGQGLDGLTGSRKIVCSHILNLAEIMDKGSNNWSDADVTNVAINLLIVQGALAESQQKGLGVQVVDQWIATLNKSNKNKRFPDLSKYRSQIIAVLNYSTQDSWGGAFIQSGSGKVISSGNTGYGSSGNGNDDGSNDDC
ncbi:uncharacterized protein LOC125239151 [Leguminivora glycinivorella]|uniref:uncharacterized protein LOC125239151 n=1 Tax=Leguminivora glycinivorella TaxID=1035111 RepID=UPI00200F7438|nr:uncharacterized protein LOC125239151 [Leguminivora glycinivorella]